MDHTLVMCPSQLCRVADRGPTPFDYDLILIAIIRRVQNAALISMLRPFRRLLRLYTAWAIRSILSDSPGPTTIPSMGRVDEGEEEDIVNELWHECWEGHTCDQARW